MIPANLEIKVDENLVKELVEKQIEATLINKFWLIDLDKIAELTCMSKRYLEEQIVCDPRMRAIEIKKIRKRWWRADLAFEVIIEITSEW